MPIAAIVGRREIMDGFKEVFFSTTFGGEALSLAASLATIQYLEKHDVVSLLWRRGQYLSDGVRGLIHDHGLEGVLEIQGYPVRTVINCLGGEGGDPWVAKSYLQQECARLGLLFSGSHNICLAHTDSIIEKTLRVYDEVFQLLGSLIKRKEDIRSHVRGRIVEPVFRKPDASK
jgi:glutamate-1-semialdehyde 2,1-aminomutase/spore coat polysaccharide biosynthesis protein SpsF